MSSVKFQVRTTTSLTGKSLTIDQFDILALDSQVRAHGELNELQKGVDSFEGDLHFETDLHFANWVKELGFEETWPALVGDVKTKGNLNLGPHLNWTGDVQVSGQDLAVGHFQLGNVQLNGKYKNGITSFSDVVFDHPSGDVRVTNLEMEIPFSHIESGVRIKGELETERLDLHDLLFSLGIGDLDLDLGIIAKIKCEGLLGKDLGIECDGKATGEDFEVRSGPDSPKDTIAAFDAATASGHFTLSSSQIVFKAQIETPNGDKGNSQGSISFEKGFDIQFDSPDFHLSNITNLANLKVEGHGGLSGRTIGGGAFRRAQNSDGS